MERIQYVDVFRGIAILVMIFFHFIHTFSPVNVYADFPYFIEDIGAVPFIDSFGMFMFPPPPVLFLFVAGMSSYLLVTKRRSQGVEPVPIAKNVAVKYGRYVLISLPFAWFVFDLQTWLAWEEALQGIGVTIIVLALLYLVVDLTVFTGLTAMTLSAVLQAYRETLFAVVTGVVPGTGNGVVDAAGLFVWDAVFGGYFSVTNLLPFAIGGLLMIRLLYEWERPRRAVLLGAGLIVVSLVLVMAGRSLHFYHRDVPLAFFGTGSAMLIYCGVHWLWNQYPEHRVFDVMGVFGRVAFLVYIWTWILVIKVAEVSGVAGTMGHAEAWIASGVITGLTVAASLQYYAFRQAHGPLMLMAWNRVQEHR